MIPRRSKGSIATQSAENSLISKSRSFSDFNSPDVLSAALQSVGYECLPYLSLQLALFLSVKFERVRALLLEGPSGCGKSYFAKSLAEITGAELLTLSCYSGMPAQNLIESPSSLALASAMARGGQEVATDTLMNLGVLSRAFLLSQKKPVIFLVDELDKPDRGIDTFFLGPIQDSKIWLESRPPIEANIENIIIIFTKNFNRTLDEALLRRVHPIKMTYLDSNLESKILSQHCHPIIVTNLVSIADRMRNNAGSYGFERPPAPEELLQAGHYVMQLLNWGIVDFTAVGRSVWNTLAKSEHDRAVLEHMLRYHPDFYDPLVPDPRNARQDEIFKRFGRMILDQVIKDPDQERREKAWGDQN